MNLYAKLSSISVGLVMLIGVIIVYSSTTTFSSWQNLLIATFILGYAHFVIGFIYQSKSVFRSDKPVRLKQAFIALFVFAALVTYYLLVTNRITLLGLLIVPYFMGHILLNEHTLAMQQTGKVYPWSLFAGIFTWFTALLLLAVPGNSFFYRLDLSYASVTISTALLHLEPFVPMWIFITLPLVMLILGIGLLVYGIYTLRSWRTGIPLLVVVSIGTWIALFLEPIAYVYLLTFILSYHFVLWMVHFGVHFYGHSKKEFVRYVLLHVLIIVPLAFASVFKGGALGWLYSVFLHSWTFAIFTYIHITLAFLNETWMHRLLRV